MAKKRRKRRTAKEAPVDPSEVPPRSFIFSRGRVPRPVRDLVNDLRSVMAPNTARNLQVRKSNRLRDFVSVASPLGITHLVVATASDAGSHLRFMRLPQGPTVTFRLSAYTLMSDIAHLRRRPRSPGGADFMVAPLVVMNNFRSVGARGADEGAEVPLVATMFQNMFPSLNVEKVKVPDCRRVVLLNRLSSTGEIEFRHYAIETTAAGVSKAIKRIVNARLPNLENLDDIAQYIMSGGTGYGSESEVEEDPNSIVDVSGATAAAAAAGLGGKRSAATSSGRVGIRLHEIGPRLTLRVLKIQKGLDEGDVLYHSYVVKSEEEEAKLRKAHKERREIKARRKREQEENVRRKKEAAEAATAKKKGGDRRERGGRDDGTDGEDSADGSRSSSGNGDHNDNDNDNDDDDDDDDAEWYRREVGEEPGDDFAKPDPASRKKRERYNPLFAKRNKKKAKTSE